MALGRSVGDGLTVSTCKVAVWLAVMGLDFSPAKLAGTSMTELRFCERHYLGDIDVSIGLPFILRERASHNGTMEHIPVVDMAPGHSEGHDLAQQLKVSRRTFCRRVDYFGCFVICGPSLFLVLGSGEKIWIFRGSQPWN